MSFKDYSKKLWDWITGEDTTLKPAIVLSGSNVGIENPFNTAEGQLVVSPAETFWSRLLREGRWKHVYVFQFSVTASTTATAAIMSPSLGTLFYPKYACMSCDSDAILQLRIEPGFSDDFVIYHSVFVKAGTPFAMDFDGDILLQEGGTITWNVTPTGNGKAHGSIYGIEVAKNA